MQTEEERSLALAEECARQAAFVDAANRADPNSCGSWTPPQPISLST